MNNTLGTVPGTVYVDAVEATGTVLLVTVDDDLDSAVLMLTPQNARKLAQQLITVAEQVWACEERHSNGVGTAFEEQP
jgi:hypothetical protein